MIKTKHLGKANERKGKEKQELLYDRGKGDLINEFTVERLPEAHGKVKKVPRIINQATSLRQNTI